MSELQPTRRPDIKYSLSTVSAEELSVTRPHRTKSSHKKPKEKLKLLVEINTQADSERREQWKPENVFNSSWGRPVEFINFAQLIIAEHIISLAITKLRYLLPSDIVTEVLSNKKKRTEMSRDGVDSGILRDVLLAEFRGRKRSDCNAPLTGEDVRVKGALEKLFLDTIAWELDEETAIIGTQTLELLIEVLSYLPHACQQSVQVLECAVEKWQQRHDKEMRADFHSANKKTKNEKELQETIDWMTEQRQKLETFILDMQRDLKLAERENSDIEARALVEIEYLKDCSQLSNEFEYWSMERAECQAQQQQAYHKAVQYLLPQMVENVKENYEKLLKDIEQREMLLREKDRASQATLEIQLAHAKHEVGKVESEIFESHIRKQDMQREVLEWRKQSAEEKAQLEEFVRMCNAVIRIQRWWKWSTWKKRKWGKKKRKGKSKKGKGSRKNYKEAKSKKSK